MGERQYMMGARQVEAQQSIRIAFDRLVREIRDTSSRGRTTPSRLRNK